jgi:hypothetical protein
MQRLIHYSTPVCDNPGSVALARVASTSTTKHHMCTVPYCNMLYSSTVLLYSTTLSRVLRTVQYLYYVNEFTLLLHYLQVHYYYSVKEGTIQPRLVSLAWTPKIWMETCERWIAVMCIVCVKKLGLFFFSERIIDDVRPSHSSSSSILIIFFYIYIYIYIYQKTYRSFAIASVEPTQ